MIKKIILTIIVLVVIVGGLFLIKKSQFAAMGAAVYMPPPDTVTAITVHEQSWENTVGSTGSLVAVQGVTVSTELPGKIAQIAFESGATVKAGDLLVQMDVSNEEAQLRAAEASAAWTKISLDRSRELLDKKSVSQAEVDSADAQYKQAVASADGIRAVIEKKAIRAPFDGRLGIRLVNLGQILKAGDPIASLQTLDPIYVNFSLPQQQLAVLASGAPVRITSDAAPGEIFEGKINAINPDVDPVTRNVRVQATLANTREKLRPGMFANVDVVLPHSEQVLVIPAPSVLYAPYGDSVFVVDERKDEKTGKVAKVLRQQFIRLGDTRGDFVIVLSGLKAGDTIVTSGGFKLRSGESVVIDNTLAPNAQLAPKPSDT